MTEPTVNFSSTQVVEEGSPYAPPVENPLPRAVRRRNFFELLDGEWRFDLDLEDRGIRERWAVQHDFPDTAVWPGSVEAHMAHGKAEQTDHQNEQAAAATQPWQDKVIAWYEREFIVPDRST